MELALSLLPARFYWPVSRACLGSSCAATRAAYPLSTSSPMNKRTKNARPNSRRAVASSQVFPRRGGFPRDGGREPNWAVNSSAGTRRIRFRRVYVHAVHARPFRLPLRRHRSQPDFSSRQGFVKSLPLPGPESLLLPVAGYSTARGRSIRGEVRLLPTAALFLPAPGQMKERLIQQRQTSGFGADCSLRSGLNAQRITRPSPSGISSIAEDSGAAFQPCRTFAWLVSAIDSRRT